MANRKIHLVGSVPMATAADVFETISAAFGSGIDQIPDGEVGERGDWITHLEVLFKDNPSFEPSDEKFGVHSGSKKLQRYQLRAGVKAENVRFGDLGYAKHALLSYKQFRQVRDAGKMPPNTRFQVNLVPAHSVLWLFVVEREQTLLDPVYNRVLLGELKTIVDEIPSEDLAIQFDIASAVFARLERGEPSVYGKNKSEMVDSFSYIVAGLADKVPDEIPLLFHFCYGDANHRHAIEPTDMSDMVSIANALRQKISRPINLIHMPVPRDRSDDAYFAPLKNLVLDQQTELNLGLVHHTDGEEGTRRRIDVASTCVKEFGISTECGFGRRDPATIEKLLQVHLDAASYATALS